MKEQPASIPENRSSAVTAGELTRGILEGSRISLGRAITLVESTRQEHQEVAAEIIQGCLPHAGRSVRIGITGTPGVGKSTLIERLGTELVEKGHKVAVLAIDPTSRLTKGSILGDKTRMEKLGNHPNAFIRPSPAGDTLGGVARKTRESIILCEAAGYDIVFVETVGVGQSETAVHSMVDVFLLLLLPGSGDELQGIKRGIVEMADILTVNKADGENKKAAEVTRRDYRNAIHLFPLKSSGWTPKVSVCSAVTGEGVSSLWDLINEYVVFTKENEFFLAKRKEQAAYWLRESIREGLEQLFYKDEEINKRLEEFEKEVREGKISPFHAAEELIRLFRGTS